MVRSEIARILRWAVIACGLAVLAGAAVLWPNDSSGSADPLGLAADPIDAEVFSVDRLPCSTDETTTCSYITFEIDEGPNRGNLTTIEQSLSRFFEAGDDVQLIETPLDDGSTIYSFYDYQRSDSLLVLAALFIVAVVALGRWRGLGALGGLVISLGIIAFFALPSLVDGNNAVAVALVTAGAVAIVALYLAHGIGPATDVALLSTFASLAITGVLAAIFVASAQFTGFTDDATFVLDALGTGIDPRGILLAGIVIGSLGVLDDVTVTQVSAVWELRTSRPTATDRQLFASALKIGRDHISSTVNTLFLAYAGAALPLLLLFSEIGQPLTTVATREVVATEIVRALVGSIGLVASVPISTWLAVKTASPAAPRRPAQRADPAV